MAIGSEARSTFLAIVKGDASQAITEFKKLEGTVTKSTHGSSSSIGKFKSATSGLKAELLSAAKSPAVWASGIAAAGGAAIMAADKFAELGLSVGKFADASGLATETASRYAEVAGDIGISTDSLTSIFNKLNKSVDPALFERLGVTIARTSDGNVDASETFLNVVERLNEIQDPARRAQIASSLLGRGWTEAAELVNMSVGDIRKQLAAVGEEKVFTAAEVKQARDYRAAMDTLNDAIEKVVITVGQKMSPAIADAAEGLAFLVDKIGLVMDAADFLGADMGNNFASAFNELGNGEGGYIQRATAATKDFADAIPIVGGFLSDLVPDVELVTTKSSGLTDQLAGLGDGAAQSARYLGLLAQHTRESADAAVDLSSGSRLAKEQLKLLQDQIEGRRSFINLQIQLRDNATKIKELADDYAEGKITAEDYYLGVADSALESQGAVADYVAELDSISEQKKIELLASFDPAAPAATINAVQSYADTHAIQLTFETDRETRRLFAGVPPRTQTPGRRSANGGRSSGGLTLVGEYGPEMVNLPAGAMVSTAAQTRQMLSGGGGITVVVNAPVGANMIEAGRQVADALNDYYRSGGQRVA